MTECRISDCNRAAWAKDLCLMHYKRVWRHGSLDVARATPSMSKDERLRRIGWEIDQSNGCWIWCGRKAHRGHGIIDIDNGSTGAYRLAYEAWVGPIPTGLIVRHKCDNPPCINPDHLEVGTHKNNGHDMANRRRFYSKLTQKQVNEIRFAYEQGNITQQKLADQYGVCGSTVSRLITKQQWKDFYE